MKKIAVIGGSGFIGSGLTRYLSSFCKVSCLGRGENLKVLKPLVNENVSLISHDSSGSDTLADVIKDSEIVVHLAGGGGNNYFVQNPDVIGKNVRLTSEIIELCGRFSRKLVFSSSIAVYTTFAARENPLNESMRTFPDDMYGSLKLLSEHMIKDSKIEYIILRLSNIYGHSLKFQSSGVIGKFIESGSRGLPINIFTDGNNKMDYLFLDDLNRAFKSIVEKDIKNEIINIGSGCLYTLKEIASAVAEVFSEEYDKDLEITILNKDASTYADRLLSIDKAKILLGWTPSVSLKDGLQLTVRRYINDSLNTPA
jgi:nucleoside-diphosphate-sugar epimerase